MEACNNLWKEYSKSKLFILRGSVFFSLTWSTILFGVLSYSVFHNLESNLLHSQYKSIKNQFEIGIAKEIENKKNTLLSMSEYLQTEFPNASDWPNVPVSISAYTKIGQPLFEMGNSRFVALLTIVKPEEVPSFENYTTQFYKEQGYESWDISSNINALNLTTGLTYPSPDASSAQGIHNILTPVIRIAPPARKSLIMRNFYAEKNKAAAIDFLLNCTKYNHGDCTTVTDVYFVSSGTLPASAMMYPLTAKNENSGENETVGFSIIGFRWDDFLRDTVPSYADGLKATVSTSSGVNHVFRFKAGQATYTGDDIGSKSRGSEYSVSLDLPQSDYTIELSYSNEFVSHYRSYGPAIASVIAVSISLLISAIFVVYDIAMNREKREKELIAETKRLFVRYISHEIRTPLNTVHLGLQVLHEEMTELIDNGTFDHSHHENKKELNKLKESFQEWTQFISNIDESTHDAITVVSDLIDFDKLTTGMLNIERNINDIWLLFNETSKTFDVQAKSKNIKFKINVSPKDCLKDDDQITQNHKSSLSKTQNNKDEVVNEYKASNLIVYGDNSKIQQVLRNLISNALKFTPEGGEVNISALWKRDSFPCPSMDLSQNEDYDVIAPEGHTQSGTIEVRVSDSGAGMTPEQVDQLFQEGVQFDANKLQAGQGSGLGLWISKGVVERHYGQLSATSKGKGHGSEFILQMPVFLPNDVINASPSSWSQNSHHEILPATSTPFFLKHSSTNSTSNSNSPIPTPASSVCHQSQESDQMSVSSQDLMTVLVVDDAASTRKMLCRLLKKRNCDTIEAGDGIECLEMVAKQTSIDLILMDFEMPKMNGPDTVKKLGELGCKIPVIGLTGNVLEEDTQIFLDNGAVNVLTKPMNLLHLKKILENVSIGKSLAGFPDSPCKLLSKDNPDFPEILPSVVEVPSPIQLTSKTASPSSSSSSSSSTTISKDLEGSNIEMSSSFQSNTKPLQADEKEKNDIQNKPRKNILVVDDVASTRKVICRLLKNCQCDTIEAGDGQHALDIISNADQTPIDLILMDFEMPIMNGPTATNKLRQIGCKIPVVGVTGNVLKSDTDYFLKMGALEVLHKPLNVNMVKDLLHRKFGNMFLPSTNLKKKIINKPPTDAKSDKIEQNKAPPVKKLDNEDWYLMALNL